MAFAPNDLYSNLANRGSLPKIGFAQILYNCWTDKVTKFDSNSFYNWEQDNQPLYDLEERTYYNWERNGFPTSSHTLVGINLVVSADAPDSVIGCNKNVFRTVSAAVNAIPEYIDTPVLVEVCNLGNLGELVIENKRFGPNGSIEIINRAFAEAEPYASATVGGVTYNNLIGSLTSDNLISAIGIAGPAAAFLPEGVSLNGHFNNTSSVILGCTVLSSISDARMTNQLSLFITTVQTAAPNRLTASIWDRNTAYNPATYPTNDPLLRFTPYELNADPKDEISTHDVIPRSFEYGNFDTAINGLGYLNRFTKIKIANCDSGTKFSGFIFLRNFHVDGRSTSTEYGIEISNSSKVFLENCTVSRCLNAGFYFNNSKVYVARGLVGYRNYAPSTTGQSRLSGDWDTKKYRNVYGSDKLLEGKGCGLLAVNSEIEFFSTKLIERIFWTTDIGYIAVNDSDDVANVPYFGANTFFNFSRNDIGIMMVNSTFKGGELTRNYTVKLYGYPSINAQLNTEAGIQLVNSTWDFDGKTEVFGNNYGFVANNSKVNLDLFAAFGNWNTGLVLKNSTAIYNKNLDFVTNSEAGLNFWFNNNGQNILMESSELLPKLTFNMPSRFSYLRFDNNVGYDNPDLTTAGGSMLPSIELIDSKAVLVHPRIAKTTSNQEPLKGVVAAKSNSELTLKGSKQYATRVIGPTTYENQEKIAALYAGDNSKIKIEGPTVIAQFAVDALAENNSVIDIGPHRNSNNAGLDISGYNLVDKDNHTMVELHSTRACLIVDKNSVLDIRDLGNYKALWDVGEYGSLAITSGVNYDLENTGNAFAPYVSAGFIQFYPNPNDSSVYTSIGKASVTPGTNASFLNGQNGSRYYISSIWNDNNGETNAQAITGGGVCVRALNQSKVNVLNTHFLTGWWNPSGIIYDADGFDTVQLCNRLFIWNIADNSQIAAALVSVSGAHPIDVGYHGPKGVWTTSGLQIAGVETQLSGAPISTPDTSSLSILDYYGACSGNPYGFSSFENFGPFRLYFSTDPACNWLYNAGDGSTAEGLASQVFAQGYQLPRNFAAPSSVSATYISLLRKNESTGAIETSGFYYGSSMLFSPFTQRAVLDESAANLFANAKHCSVGKSGLGRVVAINFPWNLIWAGDTASQAKTAGIGFRSPNTFDLSRTD